MTNANPAPAGPPAIAMRDVAIGSLRDPGVTRFTGVNWTVNPGEFWVVAAPQFSGKTDFLMTVGGVMSPMAGEYRLLGEPMPIFEEPRLQHRLRLGLVFDGGQLFSQLTVAENIALPIRYHRRQPAAETDAQVQALMELIEIKPWADTTPANLGRSLQQRVGLARALALRPEILLLDSPLTGLDARHTSWWRHFLEQLRRGQAWTGGQPVTLVVTVDDLRPWRGHATHVACLADKKMMVACDWQAAESNQLPIMCEMLRPEIDAIDPGDTF